MLFVADWYLPDSPQAFVREAYVDKSIIRIKSAHKWPERIVIDASLPTTVPPPSAVLANTPVINQPREAFAQLDAPSQQVSRNPSLPSSKPKAAKKLPTPEWRLIESPRRTRCRRSHLGRSCRLAGNEEFSAAGKIPNCAGTPA